MRKLKKKLTALGVGFNLEADGLVFNFENDPEDYRIRWRLKPLQEKKHSLPTCVLVIGIPRSGTSLVANILHHLGVKMGPFTEIKTEMNPDGYFEHSDFSEFHCSITQDPTLEHWWNLHRTYQLSSKQYATYQAIIRHAERDRLWGLKDLRILQFIDIFLRLVHSRILVIEPIRLREAVIKSMQRYLEYEEMDFKEEDVPHFFYNWNVLKIRAITQLTRYGALRLTVPYEALLKAPDSIITEIAGFIGVEPTQEAVDVVDPTLNHWSE